MKQSTADRRYQTKPYVIINCAMSIDGKIALPSGKQIKLSSLEDFKRVHQLRNYCDGILVGINTILVDDPKLTIKRKLISDSNFKNPIRIILDTTGRTPKDSHVLDGTAQTFIVMGEKHRNISKNFKNADIIYCKLTQDGLIDLLDLLKTMKNNGIENLLVEGGSTVIYNFLKNNLVDEMYIYMSNVIIGGTTTPTLAGGTGAEHEDDLIKLRLLSCERVSDGLLLKFQK